MTAKEYTQAANAFRQDDYALAIIIVAESLRGSEYRTTRVALETIAVAVERCQPPVSLEIPEA